MAPSIKIVGGSSVAFNPGPTNLQVVNGHLYVPRQYGPLNAASQDIFELNIKSRLASSASYVLADVRFVDDWNLYHALCGEIHCGSVVKRSVLPIDWWEHQPW